MTPTKWTSIFVVVLLLFLGSGFRSHKFYVSTTTINYKNEKKVLQISAQIFIDDMELVLRQQNPTLQLAPDSDEKEINQRISDYFAAQLKLSLGTVVLPLNYLGKEYKNDILVSYIEVPFEQLSDSLVIENTLLFEQFEDQKNIIHFVNGDKRKSFLLNATQPAAQIALKNFE